MNSLPIELIDLIFYFLNPYDRYIGACVCHYWSLLEIQSHKKVKVNIPPLEYYSKYNNISLLEWYSPKENEFNQNTMLEVTKLGYFDIIKWLYDRGCVITRYTLNNAILNDHTDIVHWLISKYCHAGPSAYVIATLRNNIPLLDFLCRTGYVYDETLLVNALEKNNFAIVSWIIQNCKNMVPSEKTFLAAINSGSITLFGQITRQWDIPIPNDIYHYIIINGDMHMLRWFYYQYDYPNDNNTFDHGPDNIVLAIHMNNQEIFNFLFNHDFEIDETAVTAAVQIDSVDFLETLIGLGIEVDYTAYRAAIQNKSLRMCQWLYDRDIELDSYRIFKEAIKTGDIEMIKWVTQYNCPWEDYLLGKAAMHCDLPSFTYIYNRHGIHNNSVKTDTDIAASAAASGNMDLVQWLHSKQFTFDSDSITNAILTNDLDMMSWIYESTSAHPDEDSFTAAIYNDNYDLVVWLIELDTPPNEDSLFLAVKKENIKIITLLLDNNFPLDFQTFEHAVLAKDPYILDMLLMYAFVNQYPPFDRTLLNYFELFEWIVCNGDFRKLEIAKKYGLESNYTLYMHAINNDNLAVIKWLHENEIEWREEVFNSAIKNGNMRIIEWLCVNGCPINVAEAFEYSKSKIIRNWIQEVLKYHP